MRGVLTYHSLDASGSTISVDPGDFDRQMKWLSSSGVRVVPLTAILDPGEGDRVALTFDDGFSNFEESALPILRDYDFPATVFVVSRHVGATNSWPGSAASTRIPTLPLMDWHGVWRIAVAGIEIGAHSQTHPDLRRMPKSQLNSEIEGCRDDIARELGVAPRSFCYPYGEVSDAVRDAVADASFTLAVTTELRAIDSQLVDSRLIPRIDMYYFREPGGLESWGSPAFTRRLLMRRAARRVRSMVRN